MRPKDFEDNATPSENSLAAHALLRLAALTGDDEARRRATGWIRRVTPVVGEHPTAFAYLLRAVERLVAPPMEVVVVGEAGDATRRAGRRAPGAAPADRGARVVAPPGVGTDLTPLLEGRAEAGDGDRVRVPAVLLPVAGDRA